MNTDNEDDKVLVFAEYKKPDDEQVGLTIKPRPHQAIICRHLRSEIDQYTRMITCKNCGITIEPYDWIMTIGKQWETLNTKKADLAYANKQASKELDELRRQIKNAKAQLRRLESKL